MIPRRMRSISFIRPLPFLTFRDTLEAKGGENLELQRVRPFPAPRCAGGPLRHAAGRRPLHARALLCPGGKYIRHLLSLSAQELKVLYWAVSETRNDVREFLGEASLTAPDREAALETQRACNRLLRGFAAAFSQNGIDIRSLFGP